MQTLLLFIVNVAVSHMLKADLNDAEDSTGLSSTSPLKRHNPCMLSHENLEQHTKFDYPQDQTPNLPDKLHITIAEGVGTSRSISTDSSHDPELETPVLVHIPFPDSIVTDSERPPHVRFRPRVRISSGFSRHRHQHFPSRQDDLISISPDSTLSSSPSSSISVPLRSCSDGEANKSAWGPLGQRMSLLAHKHRRQTKRQRRNQHDAQANPSDHTPLMRSPPPTAYVEGEDVYEEMEDSNRETRSSREVDAMFGTWPERLTNIHWWWWHLASVVQCRCLDEYDTE